MSYFQKNHKRSQQLIKFSLIDKEIEPKFFAGVTIMLSITIFATIVGEMLPVSDATPLIG